MGENDLKKADRPGRNGGRLLTGHKYPNQGGRDRRLPPLKELLGDVLGSEGGSLESSEIRAILNKLVERASKKGDTKAARLLFEYAYGKPNQNISVTGEDGGPIKVVSTGLNSDERKLLDKLLPGLNVGDNE
jgi:hypothetical protein